MVNTYIWREMRDIKDPAQHQFTGYDRASMRRCWEFLDLTSRSFSMVIKELEGDLARVVRVYLSIRIEPLARSSTRRCWWKPDELIHRCAFSTSSSARSTRWKTT